MNQGSPSLTGITRERFTAEEERGGGGGESKKRKEKEEEGKDRRGRRKLETKRF